MTFKKNYYSGICMCGHSWNRHHQSVVARIEYIEQTNEGTIPGECLFYGCNELGGLGPHPADPDAEREIHCYGYVDRENPDPEERSRWHGTVG